MNLVPLKIFVIRPKRFNLEVVEDECPESSIKCLALLIYLPLWIRKRLFICFSNCWTNQFAFVMIRSNVFLLVIIPSASHQNVHTHNNTMACTLKSLRIHYNTLILRLLENYPVFRLVIILDIHS